MGIEFFDIWTVVHFVWGFISTSILIPSRPFLSAIIVNFIHLVMEFVENRYNKEGKDIESISNHIGDILGFLIGSIVGILYGSKYFIQPGTETLRYVLIAFSLLALIQETGRELFPDTWPIAPAFHENRYFGYDIKTKFVKIK